VLRKQNHKLSPRQNYYYFNFFNETEPSNARDSHKHSSRNEDRVRSSLAKTERGSKQCTLDQAFRGDAQNGMGMGVGMGMGIGMGKRICLIE